VFCCFATERQPRKRQNSVEASTFGSEFTATNDAIKMMEAMRHKLRMFGVPTEGPATHTFCDDAAVCCANTLQPKSTPAKKPHSVACHRSRETVAAGMVRALLKERASTNLADIFTKTVAAPKRERGAIRQFCLLRGKLLVCVVFHPCQGFP
jgi:hypothetical protein